MVSHAAFVGEGVVNVVVVGAGWCLSAKFTKQPELFEMADVGKVPDQRRHQGGDLFDEVLPRERC